MHALYLSDSTPSEGTERLPWYAVQVRYQNELRTARFLREKGYEEFVPFYRTRRQWSDRVKEMDVPLFPGYVFCRFDAQRWLPVKTTMGVVSIVGIGNIPAAIEEPEIEAIRAVMRGGIAAEPWPFLREGQRVRVCAGAMRGHEGVLLSLKNQTRLVLSVSLLQRSVAIEIDREFVEPVFQCPAKQAFAKTE
jgi:transcription antitermination factor NusG